MRECALPAPDRLDLRRRMHHAADEIQGLPELATRARRARKAESVKAFLDVYCRRVYHFVLCYLTVKAFLCLMVAR